MIKKARLDSDLLDLVGETDQSERERSISPNHMNHTNHNRSNHHHNHQNYHKHNLNIHLLHNSSHNQSSDHQSCEEKQHQNHLHHHLKLNGETVIEGIRESNVRMTGNSSSGDNSLGSSPSPVASGLTPNGSSSTGNINNTSNSTCSNNCNSSVSITTNNNHLSTSVSPSSPETTPNLSQTNNREPDPNAIKMFVGQIPRDWSEIECRSLFEEFGEIYSLNVLKDKTTGLSKGCCFVTFYSRKSALEAQNALHNVKTLPGMHHPIQMKPADSENRNERKLFIGMLSKKYAETEVKLMFAPFGIIEECTVLKDGNGLSKGCAFVTFTSRQCAVNAIKAMNHSQTMEGCSSPLVVKFADTQRDKDARRQQQILMQHLAAAAVAHQPATPPVTLATATTNPYLALAAAAATAQQQQQHIAAATLALQHRQLAASISQGTDQLALAAAANLASSPVMLATLCPGASSNGTHTVTSVGGQSHLPFSNLKDYHHGTVKLMGANMGPGGNISSTGLPQFATLTNGQHNNYSGTGHSTPGPTPTSVANSVAVTNGSISAAVAAAAAASSLHSHRTNHSLGKPMEGPDGANLFIYHLPSDFGDDELASIFAAFGRVLSSKVFIDKHTNLSKCFGFVSYDNVISAQAAIQAMNGFQIGAKRLKVQLKKCKEKPY